MKIHIVKSGDTLYFLAKENNVSLEQLIQMNPHIKNPDQLQIGDKIKIPTSSTTLPSAHQYTIKQGDTLWKLAGQWGVSLNDIIEANPQLADPDVLQIGEIIHVPHKQKEIPFVPFKKEVKIPVQEQVPQIPQQKIEYAPEPLAKHPPEPLVEYAPKPITEKKPLHMSEGFQSPFHVKIPPVEQLKTEAIKMPHYGKTCDCCPHHAGQVEFFSPMPAPFIQPWSNGHSFHLKEELGNLTKQNPNMYSGIVEQEAVPPMPNDVCDRCAGSTYNANLDPARQIPLASMMFVPRPACNCHAQQTNLEADDTRTPKSVTAKKTPLRKKNSTRNHRARSLSNEQKMTRKKNKNPWIFR